MLEQADPREPCVIGYLQGVVHWATVSDGIFMRTIPDLLSTLHDFYFITETLLPSPRRWKTDAAPSFRGSRCTRST